VFLRHPIERFDQLADRPFLCEFVVSVFDECVYCPALRFVPGFRGDDCPSLTLAFVREKGNRRGKEQQQVGDTPSTVVGSIPTLGCRREREPYCFTLGECR
jgi:hypothetical protein